MDGRTSSKIPSENIYAFANGRTHTQKEKKNQSGLHLEDPGTLLSAGQFSLASGLRLQPRLLSPSTYTWRGA